MKIIENEENIKMKVLILVINSNLNVCQNNGKV
jgi:hypothetical protein